jgi:hypothetical protein
MSKTMKVFMMLALVAMVSGGFAVAAHAQATVYTVLNNDVYSGFNGSFNTGSVFINNNLSATVLNTGSYGLGGGYFGIPRVDIAVSSGGKCVFLADAGGTSGGGPGDIASFNYPSFVGLTTSSNGGNGYLYGIGLSSEGNVLLAGWSANNVLESFKIGSGCTLSAINAVSISGAGGGIDGVQIAPNGKWYLVTTADGDYEVGSITGGVLGAATAYSATCASTYGGLPTGTAIDSTSTYGYVDCLGGTAALIDAFNISAPGTITESGPLNSLGGTPIYGSNTMGLSNDNKLMDVNGTFSGSVETVKVSGLTLTDAGCASGNVSLPGYGSTWIYPGTINVLGSSAASAGGAVVTEASFGYTSDSYEQELINTTGNCLATHGTQGSNGGASYLALSGASYLKP